MDAPNVAEVNSIEEYREKLAKFARDNPQSVGLIAAAIIVIAALAIAAFRRPQEERKPKTKVVRIHERIIERPVHMSRRDPRDKQEKPKDEAKPKNEEKPEGEKPESENSKPKENE